jgi:hypothetical protein
MFVENNPHGWMDGCGNTNFIKATVTVILDGKKHI